MSIPDILDYVQQTALARVITKSDHLVIASLQVVHVLGFVLLLSTLVLMSLKSCGAVLTRQSSKRVFHDTRRLLWLGVVLAVASGLLMFMTGTRHYFYNYAFDIKMALLLLAIGAQIAVFPGLVRDDSTRAWKVVGVALSLALWFGVGIAGRAIGFVR